MFRNYHGTIGAGAFILLLPCSLISYATAQETEGEQSAVNPAEQTTTDGGNKDQVEFAPARVRVACLASGTKWTGDQLDNSRLIDIAFPECTYIPALGGGGKLLLRSEVVLNPDAPIAKCVSFSTAFMFHVEVDTATTQAPGFAWEGHYVIEDQLLISNLYGETISLDFVPVYDPSTKKDADKPLSYHMFPSRTTPSFDEYYVGNVELLAEDGSSGLSREIFQVSPPFSSVKNGEWDLDVRLKVKIFKPKGWCYSADVEGNVIEPPLGILFKEAEK
jgi:hypothetical protein